MLLNRENKGELHTINDCNLHCMHVLKDSVSEREEEKERKIRENGRGREERRRKGRFTYAHAFLIFER